MLTDTEKAQLRTLITNLKTTPRSFSELSATTRAIIRREGAHIREQREFFQEWWLQVDAAKLAEINALLPPHNIVEPRVDINGLLWVCSDLVSDPRLNAVLPLRLLKLTFKDATHWPSKG